MILTPKITTKISIPVISLPCQSGDGDEDSDQMENERTYSLHHTFVDSLNRYLKYDLA